MISCRDPSYRNISFLFECFFLANSVSYHPLAVEKVCIITTDGRTLVGTLVSHDNTTNLVS